ncbi:MAG: hypothetical protein WC876_12390, partial [Candidatus Thermoplasmatota archaeon]
MRVFVAAVLLLTSLLAGCADDKDPSTDAPAGSASSASSSAAPAVVPVLYLNITIGNGTHRFSSAPSGGVPSANSTSAGNATTNATGNATLPSGAAPLNVTFDLGASRISAGAIVLWSFDFGRAGSSNGTANATG